MWMGSYKREHLCADKGERGEKGAPGSERFRGGGAPIGASWLGLEGLRRKGRGILWLLVAGGLEELFRLRQRIDQK